MSINISKAVCRVADSINVTVNTDRLGPRQRSSLRRFVLTGVITGNSVPGRLAESILVKHNMPHVVVGRHRSIQWSNVGVNEESFWLWMDAMLAAAELGADKMHPYYEGHTSRLRYAVRERVRDYDQWLGRQYNTKILRSIKFGSCMPANYEVPRVFTFDALKGERL